MSRASLRAAAIDRRGPVIAIAMAFLLAAAGLAHGQTTTPPEKLAAPQAVPNTPVIKPPAHIDPGMRVTPPATQQQFKTPIIKPQPVGKPKPQ